VHNILGQKRHSACGLLASRLTNNAGVCCNTLKKLCHAIQNKQCGIVSWGVAMIHDNARPHTAMQNLITTFGWEHLDHPPYSPLLVPSDFHFFLHPKSFLVGRWFHEDSEVKEAITMCFAKQETSFDDEGIQKLVPRYDKCLKNRGYYVEM